MATYPSVSVKNYIPDDNDNIMNDLFLQYRKVIVESIITSFGLDFLINDQHGGDVDTILNVRKIGDDSSMYYKNVKNEENYNNRGDYSKSKIDSDPKFIDFRDEQKKERLKGTLKDEYTGKTLKKDAEVDIDHTIATKTIHDDRGANLSGVDVNELANDKSNLAPTNSALNRSMQDKTADEYKAYMDEKKAHVQANIDELKSKSNMTEKDKQKLAKYENRKDELDEQFNDDTYKNLKRKEAQAKKVYEAKINATYYTSSKFVTDTAKAAANVGARMGVRQVVGFIFTEIWFSVEDEFKKIKDDFDLGKLLNAIGIGVKKGFINAKEKYKELWDKLCSGTVAGIISSVTTTICNIFFTTSKNVVRVIRQSYASLVDAAKVLFLNPDQLVLGERIRAFAKILSTGASIVVGTLVSQGIENTPILGIPVVGDIIPEFCGSFVTGIMTCSLLFFFDRSEVIK